MDRDLHIELAGRVGCATREIGDWATTHFGVISRRKLLALGVDRLRVHRLLASGFLRATAYEGVYVVGHGAEVAGQREVIALAASGSEARLTGRSHADWCGMTDPWKGPVELMVPMGRHRALPDINRRVVDLPSFDATSHRGLPCTTPQRTVMHLPPEHLRQALQWLMKRGIALEPIVERMHGRRGARAFRAEVEQLIPQMAHTLSELEDRFLRLCRRYGIPLPEVNRRRGSDLLDCTWPGHRLTVELDGRRWHEHRDRQDKARDRRRLLEGALPFRYGWADVVHDHAATAGEVTRALRLE